MTKINSNMKLSEMVYEMSEGNEEAANVCMQLITNKANPNGMLQLMILDKYGIYGEKISKLFNKCCERSLEEFKATVRMLQFEEIPKELFLQNLERSEPLNFLDKGIFFKGYDVYHDEIEDIDAFDESMKKHADSYMLRNAEEEKRDSAPQRK